jgi:nucleotide-binding universal stress UspA family protein
MTNDERKPVVVGIDGSTAALDAARWAVGEAMARDVPLRLVHVAYTPRTLVDLELTDEEREHGEQSLRTASAAVELMGQPVKIEADLVWGLPSDVLLAESRHAAMVCLGTSGIGAVARAVLGSTAATVAERAHCSVAVIHPPTGVRGTSENWVAVGIDDRSDADVAVRAALDEARIRHAAMVAIGLGCNAFGVNTAERTERRVNRWRTVYPHVAAD